MRPNKGGWTALSLAVVFGAGGIVALADRGGLTQATKTPAGSPRTLGGVAVDCTDADGDGYGVGADCLGPDCNDGNPAVHPGATEVCNGIDDNCNGQIDEGFVLVLGRDGTAACSGGSHNGQKCYVAADCPGGACLGNSPTFLQFKDLPLGAQCVNGFGVCAAIGDVVCKADGSGAECNAVPGPSDPRGEGCAIDANGQAVIDPNTNKCVVDAAAPTCFDHLDNDCDGLVDHGGVDQLNVRHNTNCTTPELCDGFDNDNNGLIDDGLGLGQPCTVGVGMCMNTGQKVCDGHGGVTCNATPLPAGVENTPGSPRCTDGKDNDCDGLIDLADPGCQTAEKCDGKDNDGDGVIDNGFALGELCSVGVGACRAIGVTVCSADGTGVVCNAVPGKGSPEGPSGPTCTDGIDNDCNGLTDAEDPNCGAEGLAVTCALLRFSGNDDDEHGCGDDGDADEDDDEACQTKHRVFFETHKAGLSDAVTAELLAIDASGVIVQSIPVQNGDTVRLDHRIDQPISSSIKPPSAKQTLARFNHLGVGDTFTLLPVSGQTKLPTNVYLNALRLPEGLPVENTRLKLDCSVPIGPGAKFGSFQVVSLISVSPPPPGRACKNGVKSITLRYTGEGSAGGALGVDIIAATGHDLPRETVSLVAPVPVLRVTVGSSQASVQAFCSSIPYVDVIQPTDSAVGDASAKVPVLAMIPNVDPSTLLIKVDGVDVLAGLGIDPMRQLPGGPFNGQIQVGANTVGVSDLFVRSTPIDIPGTNTVSMALSNLGCGAHIVTVDGHALPVCKGRPSVLSLRYDGGGCANSAETQCDKKFNCSGAAGTTTPVRIMATDRHGSVLLDTGSPASIGLGDTVRIVAADLGRQTLPCDTVVKVSDAGGALLETVGFHTTCSQPLTVGYVFGGLRVVGLETVHVHDEGDDECDDDNSGEHGHAGVTSLGDQSARVSPRSGISTVGGGAPPSVGGVADGGDDEHDDEPPPVCYVDDLHDAGTALVFKIDIAQPTEGQIVPLAPVHVVGEACHGHPITSVKINGFSVDTSAQVLTPGNGVDAGDSYKLDFAVDVPVTDLRAAIDSGGGAPGTFDPGPNRLIAQALDGDFNATYDNLFFAVGPVTSTPSAASASVVAADPGEITRAFVLSITQNGINTFFEALKNKNKKCLGDKAKKNFDGLRNKKDLPVDGACDPPTTMVINNSALQSDVFPLQLTLDQDVIHVKILLPSINLFAHFSGYCEDGCICAFGGCACAVCVTVDIDGKMVQKNMSLSFDVTEARLLQTGVPRDQRQPLDVTFYKGDNDPADAVKLSGDVDIGCLLGFILDVLSFFVLIFTLGFVDLDLSTISFEFTGDDIKDKMGGLDGDPFDLDLVKFKNDDMPEFGTKQKDSKVNDVAITPTGIAVGIGASFVPDPSQLDPTAANIPGTALTNAPLPEPPILDAAGNPAGDVTIAIADDVFNQLFNSMVQTGRLKTQFEVAKTLGDFIPSVCSTISDPQRQARCVGIHAPETPGQRFCARLDGGFTDACEAAYPYVGGDDNLRRQCCRAARIGRNANIRVTSSVILHGQIGAPPQLLIHDNPATPPVEVVLRYPQASLTIIADRDGNTHFDAGTLASIPDCSFGDLDADFGTQSTATTECVLWETCLNIDVNLTMEIGQNPNTGRDRIKFNFQGVDRSTAFGLTCDGATDPVELDFFNEQAGRSQTFDILDNKLRDNTPPLEHDGLELGGFVEFHKDRIIAIKTNSNPNGLQDYIGITGTIVSKPVDPNAGCETP